MDATTTDAAGAGFLRRLRRHVGDAIFLTVAVGLGWLLWPSSLGGCTTLTIVSGESMEPTYYTGDLVVSRCGEEQVGDIVVYNPPNVGSARVIHRIVGGDPESGWVMQGDNNAFLDPWQPTEDRVLGRAVIHVPKLGLFAQVLLSPITWVSLLLVAGALILWPTKPEPTADAADAPDEPDETDDAPDETDDELRPDEAADAEVSKDAGTDPR